MVPGANARDLSPPGVDVPMTRRSGYLLLLVTTLSLAACGKDKPSSPPDIIEGPRCDTVAWESLLAGDETNLSAYGLFASSTDPTTNPNDTGMPYDLNTDLFTDYASKYRFVFIPCDSVAAYTEHEAFVFPVGTVIAKSFAMPADTAVRGLANETLIETRLLIRRAAGWVALPYTWLADGSDAVLDTLGSSKPMSVVHRGTARSIQLWHPRPSAVPRLPFAGWGPGADRTQSAQPEPRFRLRDGQREPARALAGGRPPARRAGRSCGHRHDARVRRRDGPDDADRRGRAKPLRQGLSGHQLRALPPSGGQLRPPHAVFRILARDRSGGRRRRPRHLPGRTAGQRRGLGPPRR